MRSTFMVLASAILMAAHSTLAKPIADPAPTFVILFIDLTSSVADDAIAPLVDAAQSIVYSLPQNTQFIALPVGKSSNVAMLASFLTPEHPAQNRSERERFARQRANDASKLGDAIRARRAHYMAENVRNEPVSCILRTFKTAQDNFAAARTLTPHANFEIVYLSDMIEECNDLTCGTSPCGMMSLSKKGYAEALAALARYEPNVKLDFARLTIVTATEGLEGLEDYVDSDRRRTFWRTAFHKAGFAEEQLAQWNFLPKLPERFSRRYSFSRDQYNARR